MANPKLSSSEVCQVAIKDLIPDPDQPRQHFDKVSLAALADSLKARGVQVPLLVRIRSTGKKNEIVIKDGERRWRAAKLAKLKTVPVLLAHIGDAAQIRLDQVSVNNLRESLKPMELARTLVRMRDQDKLSANEIAARLTKQGMPLTQAHIANLMKLTDLPQWAQDMVNDEEIEVTSARELAGITDKPVLDTIRKSIEQDVKWRGRVTLNEVQASIRHGYREHGKDLKRTESYLSDAVRFDYKKVCKGCDFLRESHGGAVCMSAEGFKKHQQEAAAAGLDHGGKKMKPAEATKAKASAGKPLTEKQQAKLDTEKATVRAGALEGKVKYYLHHWAGARIKAHLVTADGDLAQRLVEFAAAERPGLTEDAHYIAQHVKNKYADRLRKAARTHGYVALPNFLKAQGGGGEMYAAIAAELVDQLPLTETLEIAHHVFGSDIAPLWKVDADYLDLLQKAELVEVAEKNATLPEGKKAWAGLKGEEIRAAILAVADQIGVPPMLSKSYSEIEPRPERDYLEDHDDDEDFDDDQEDEE